MYRSERFGLSVFRSNYWRPTVKVILGAWMRSIFFYFVVSLYRLCCNCCWRVKPITFNRKSKQLLLDLRAFHPTSARWKYIAVCCSIWCASKLSGLMAYIGARLACVTAIIWYSLYAVRLAISSVVISNVRNNAREPEDLQGQPNSHIQRPVYILSISCIHTSPPYIWSWRRPGRIFCATSSGQKLDKSST